MPDAEHGATACKAVAGLATRLDEVNHECLRVWKQMFDYRIGINSGEMVVAAYGSRRLGAFSVAGEPVEWARRSLRARRIFSTAPASSRDPYAYQLAEEHVEALPDGTRAASQPEERTREEVYELLGRKERPVRPADRPARHFLEGRAAFSESGVGRGARGVRIRSRSTEIQDGPLEFYIRRVEQLRQGAAQVLEWDPERI